MKIYGIGIWLVAIAASLILFIGCNSLQSAEQPAASEPGAKIVDAAKSATPDDVIGAVSIVAPAVLGPWGLVLAAVARAWYTKRQGNKAVRSVQPIIDGLAPKERSGLIQDSATKRFIREARGKSFRIPI